MRSPHEPEGSSSFSDGDFVHPAFRRAGKGLTVLSGHGAHLVVRGARPGLILPHFFSSRRSSAFSRSTAESRYSGTILSRSRIRRIQIRTVSRTHSSLTDETWTLGSNRAWPGRGRSEEEKPDEGENEREERVKGHPADENRIARLH
jgi:hypothetical protein